MHPSNPSPEPVRFTRPMPQRTAYVGCQRPADEAPLPSGAVEHFEAAEEPERWDGMS